MAGFDLPNGLSGVNSGTVAGNPGTVAGKEDNLKEIEYSKLFYKTVSELPGALYKAATGEGAEVEFPDLPEATEIEDIGFFESIAPNLKIMAARDDTGKAEIIRNSFKGDPRLGGVFSDKFNNPIVVWNDQPYYINKPGFSGQDIGTFIGEIAKYSPATKIVSKAKGVVNIAGRGAPSYGATELASKAGENLLAPETEKSKKQEPSRVFKDAGTATSIGVATDVVVPGVLKPAGRMIRRGAQAAGETAKSILPRYTTAIQQVTPAARAVPQASKYPLTAGQREAQPPVRDPGEKVTPQLQTEDLLRRSPMVDEGASETIRDLDKMQLTEIRGDAATIKQEIGSGLPAVSAAENPVGASAEQIQSIATKRADALKTEAGAAYKAVGDAEFPPIFSREGIVQTTGDVINSVISGELKMTAREIASMPILKRELDFLKRLGKMASNPKFKGQPLTTIHGYQKTLNRAFRQAEKGSPEQKALGNMKGVVDKAVFDGIEQGIVTGDQAILDQLKSATGLYRQYIGLTGKGSARNQPQKRANKLLEMMTDPDFTPEYFANALLGHAKFNPSQSMGLVIDKLKAALPENESEEVIALIKDGVLEKAFSGKGKSGVTRTNIVNNFEDVFVNQKTIIEKLFSPEEISRIRQFKNDVLPTMWAEIKLNPSGTAYLMLGKFAESNLLKWARGIPLIGEGVSAGLGGMKGATERSQASDAVRQYIARTSRPLFSAPISAAARPPAISDDADASVVLPLANTMSEAAKKRIIEAAQP